MENNLDLKNIVVEKLHSTEDEILNWKFCKSTLSFIIIAISWIFYSIGFISLEVETNIIIFMLTVFAVIQLFLKDDTKYTMISIYKNIKNLFHLP